ncbi:MAG: division/cell wall cluster transcriptional repressor MraZ [Nitrospirae bacterium]|nr:MAG: division/cell wall cluster transcriptional repressor MraZ [Nitrospirota bacterium]
MPGFKGKYYNSVDPKGRVMIPAPFRSILTTNYSTQMVITLSTFDDCLHLYPIPEWENFEQKVRALPRSSDAVQLILRREVASAHDCELDRQGRLLIPASLREDAGIDGEVVVVGQLDKIALWNREKWDEVNDLSRIDRKAFMRELAELGF